MALGRVHSFETQTTDWSILQGNASVVGFKPVTVGFTTLPYVQTTSLVVRLYVIVEGQFG